MKSIIFTVLVRLLKPIFFLIAFWLLLRGHNAPGGGFIAGLIAASASILQVLSGGWKSLPKWRSENLFSSAALGLSLCVFSGLLGPFVGNPFMTGRWSNYAGIMIGSPMFFDLGVFVIVESVILMCIGFLFAEEEIRS